MAMTISAIGLFGSIDAKIYGKSWRVLSPDKTMQTIVNDERDLNIMLEEGYTVLAEYTTVKEF